MSQVLWNTAHGRFFELSLDCLLDTPLVGSYLGNHVHPILLSFHTLGGMIIRAVDVMRGYRCLAWQPFFLLV